MTEPTPIGDQPAFPRTDPVGSLCQSGMSLRAYVATTALQGLLAQSNSDYIEILGHEGLKAGDKRMGQTYARIALEATDALLAELAKGKR